MPVQTALMSTESDHDEPQITDVTDDVLHSQQTDNSGEVSMDELGPESVITFPSDSETARREELSQLSKEQLVEIVMERERELRRRSKLIQRLRQQLKNSTPRPTATQEMDARDESALMDVSDTTASSDSGRNRANRKRKATKQRDLDFQAYGKRHVALRFLYLGWNYDGFVVQDETDNTVEDHIFAALMKTKLIESRESSSYHRCGRTDKSVSAFSQVISLHVRSTSASGVGLLRSATPAKLSDKEIPYLQILNGVLPKNIRMTSWSPVDIDFSARFSCRGRKYRYYFPKAGLDIAAMNSAAQLFLGEHDFRNFCKADIGGGVTNYVRRVDAIFISQMEPSCDSPNQMCILHVYGSAFLWHQVRSIVAVLALIGQGKEQPGIISDMLDITKYPAKPQYNMAEGFPLVLFDCDFDQIVWNFEEYSVNQSIKELQRLWTEHAVKAAVIMDMLSALRERQQTLVDIGESGLLSGIFPDNKGKSYQPLKSRKMCDSVEDRLVKKFKVLSDTT